ncbi:hypothetical protein OROHE_000891 [Orobanche hederae]
MAKSTGFTTATLALLFAFFILVASFDVAMVEAKLCEKPSGTWSGVCGSSSACKNQCKELEGAQHGSCNYVFPAHKCICYFNC